jgi:hypothetical protein
MGVRRTVARSGAPSVRYRDRRSVSSVERALKMRGHRSAETEIWRVSSNPHGIERRWSHLGSVRTDMVFSYSDA